MIRPIFILKPRVCIVSVMLLYVFTIIIINFTLYIRFKVEKYDISPK